MMAKNSSGMHIYKREFNPKVRNSLSVLANFISPGTRVLDIGTGSGALGRHLKIKRCSVDGITLNKAEIDGCKAHYTRLIELDLETDDLNCHFEHSDYDFIVCADVLEHIRWPHRVLESCKDLLREGGLLLVSIPNAAYAGFVVDLMHGDLRYGDEGLLDRTHLRFFTRRSFEQLLDEQGWKVEAANTIEQPWFETEFHRRFDSLPPAVARYVLAQPEASAYQLLFIASKAKDRSSPPHLKTKENWESDRPFIASYVAQLFVANDSGFSVERQITCLAHVGRHGQRLRFAIPSEWGRPTCLRLDPADRPGFLRLREIILLDEKQQKLWSWLPNKDGIAALTNSFRHHVYFGSPFSGEAWLPLLLTGDDPQIILPIPESILACGPSILEVICDWPFSADYLAAIDKIVVSKDLNSVLVATDKSATTTLESSNPFKRGLVQKGKEWIAQIGAKQKRRSAEKTVAIVIPIYGNLDLVKRCVISVLSGTTVTPWHLILINDASPESELNLWIRQFAKAHPNVTILENVRNLGFVQTVNLGMRIAGRRDVVLLNSDTEVAGDWLDRLRRAAWSNKRIASVTPFSNNATICSYPKFCLENLMIQGQTTLSLHSLFASANAGLSLEIPTAVGFCMYIRRDCLEEIGEFDAEHFDIGYGEENDWCMRAMANGWTHLHALDIFVYHEGGASFNDRRKELQIKAAETLSRIHPNYNLLIRDFLQRDPAKPYRDAVDRLLSVVA